MSGQYDAAADTHSLDELAALSGTPKRTIRYYIQLGLVDRPIGETRGARYGSRHLDQLTQIRRLSQAGLSLERIGQILARPGDLPEAAAPRPGTVETWIRLSIADGVELNFNPMRAKLPPEAVRALLQGTQELFANLAGGDHHDLQSDQSEPEPR